MDMATVAADRDRAAVDLNRIEVASHCSQSWEAMQGTDTVRCCNECRLNVYNLSGMTRAEAETLVRGHEGRMCVRFYRRADGTVLTRDCPVGVRALRRQARRLVAAVVALIAALSGGILVARSVRERQIFDADHQAGPLADLADHVEPRILFMGDLCLPIR
jgi:hypothetical protein